MSTLKDFVFHVTVEGDERTVELSAIGRPTLRIATPPEFRGGIPGRWSPEDLLVGSAATCYALTLAAMAERRAVPVRELEITGAGHVTRRADGRFGFVVIELGVKLTTEEGFEEEAEKLARVAEQRCLVGNALAVPLEVELEVRATRTAPLALTT